MPKISVVIPTHNRPELLKRALLSVYSQSFTDYDVIVVDDGDSPHTVSALADYIHKPNFFYLETKKNEGAPVARNIGIKQAKGEYVAFLDDDDQWVSQKLETQIKIFSDYSDEKVGFVFSAVEKISTSSSETTTVEEGLMDYSFISLARFKGFITSTLLVPRYILTEVGGFDESFPSHQEPDLIIRITRKYLGFGINTPLVKMRISQDDDHIGGSPQRRIDGREILLKKHYLLYKDHPTQLAKSYQWLAFTYLGIGNTKLAIYFMIKAFYKKPTLRRLANVLRFFAMNIKSFLIQKIFKPAHFGTLVREMYAKHYISKYIESNKIQKILDAGCGQGQYSIFLAKLFPRAKIDAVDILEVPSWEKYQTFKNLNFSVRDLTTLDEVATRDLIVTVDVFEHIVENVSTVKKLCLALKPGGYLYFAIPCDDTAPNIFPERWFSQFREWEKDEHIGKQLLLNEWTEIIKASNCEIVLSRHTFTLWGRFAWEIEYLLRGTKFGDKINLLLMPIFRLFGILDLYVPLGKGNNLIIAKKV